MNKMIALKIPVELDEALLEFAKKRGSCSKSSLIREAIANLVQ